ncbi:MAG: hypothetical protein LBN04_12745 [Oscillospiraceae bacterium]|jgi:uncharacterized membrane protein YkvA (DUF1232 family)|nr:hypothetical protein [Oscillospiraceae bacterium]
MKALIAIVGALYILSPLDLWIGYADDVVVLVLLVAGYVVKRKRKHSCT